MKKLSKISFKNTLNEKEMKLVTGGYTNANCSGTIATQCDGLCAPSFDGHGGVTTYKCVMSYIRGISGEKFAICSCG